METVVDGIRLVVILDIVVVTIIVDDVVVSCWGWGTSSSEEKNPLPCK